MKFATSVFAIVFIAVPALSISAEKYERSNLYGRDTDEIVDQLTRDDLNDIFGRDLVDERGFLGGVLKSAAKISRNMAKQNPLKSRKATRGLEIDEDLEMREPIKAKSAMKLFRGAKKVAGGVQKAHDMYQQSKQRREVLEEREFEEEMFEREFDEEHFERDFDDLD